MFDLARMLRSQNNPNAAAPASWSGRIGQSLLENPTAPADPTMNNPVGTSTMQSLTNPSPDVSPMIEMRDLPGMTRAQRLGLMLTRGRGRPPLASDLPEAQASGDAFYDTAMAVAGATSPVKGIRAFHGSPHKFDRFDMSKLGTGEGAQAYGHGLYFAGKEGVARSYRLAGQPGHLGANPAQIAQNAYDQAVQSGAADPIKTAREILWAKRGNLTNPTAIRLLDDASNNMEQFTKPGVLGNMYEVNLRTSPERLLDWDAPLSKQPAAVREALAKVPWAEDYIKSERLTGGQIAPKTPEGAAQLREAGLDGIRYLDGGSRAAGEGSRNYVMFDDKLIDILRRYGLLGMVGGGAAAAASGGDQ